MVKNKKKRIVGTGLIAAIGLLAFAFAFAASGSGGGVIGQNAEENGGVTIAASTVTTSINYQGRLVDSADEPLNGTFNIKFSLYEVASEGTALDTDTHTVAVENGLFNTEIDFDQGYFDGRALWLGIKVGTDSEMTLRQELKPVPYALSLRPGAVINGSLSGPVLKVNSNGSNSYGVYAYTTGEDSEGFYANTTGDDSEGFYAETDGDYSEGVNARTTGKYSEGVYARTSGKFSPAVYGWSKRDAGVYGKGKCGGYFETDQGGTSSNQNVGVKALILAKSFGVYAYSANYDAIYAETGGSDKYGLRTPNKICAEGGLDTTCSDIAEHFAVDKDVEAATVMIIGEDSKLKCSTKAYDTTVAGIVSTSPGVSLGTKEAGNDGEKLIAVTGRVPCKVDASYAPIEPGDMLTTSDTPGHAMKAQPVVIGEVEIYRPGTTLGKALEPLDSGTGTIEVLVTLQ